MLPIQAMRVRAATGGGGGGSATTWDPAAKGANITLSNSNMDAQAAGVGWQSLFAVSGKSSGKHQFEVKLTSGVDVNRPFAGIADKSNAANVLTTYLGQSSSQIESAGYWGHGRVYHALSGGAGVGFSGVLAGSLVDDIVTVAVDLDSLNCAWYLNGTLLHTVSLPSGKTWYPAASVQFGGKVQLIASALTHPVVGFMPWT